jgi:hypothetical protein
MALCIKIYNNIILPVVFKWSPTLREEHRLTVYDNRVLRRIFGPKRADMTGWRKLHHEELPPNIIRMIKSRRIKWVGHVARMW